MKRYQECNSIEKIYRRRHYVSVPFLFIYHQYIKPFKVINDSDGSVYNPKGKNLWKILIGTTHCKMNWVYTMDEVFDRLKDH
jgi:hypothetical protein